MLICSQGDISHPTLKHKLIWICWDMNKSNSFFCVSPKMKIQSLFIHSTRPFWNFTAIQHPPKRLKYMGMVINIFGSPEATNWFEKTLFTPFRKLKSSLQLCVGGVNDVPSNQIWILGLGLCWRRCLEPFYCCLFLLFWFLTFYFSYLGECVNAVLQLSSRDRGWYTWVSR